jgi:hypothetical protein
MIRKALIIVLTLAAVGMAVIWAGSYRIHHVPLTPEERKLFGGGAIPSVWKIRGWLIRLHGTERAFIEVREGAGILSTCDPWLKADAKVERADVRVAGFGYRSFGRSTCSPTSDRTFPHYRLQDITVPLWFPSALFAAYPAIAFTRGPLRRWRRRRKGLCVKCGYNLTGNVSGVCPECGIEVESS